MSGPGSRLRASLLPTLTASLPLGALFGIALRLGEMRCETPDGFATASGRTGLARLLDQMPLLAQSPWAAFPPILLVALAFTLILLIPAQIKAIPALAVFLVLGSILTTTLLFALLILPGFCDLGLSATAFAALMVLGAGTLAALCLLFLRRPDV